MNALVEMLNAWGGRFADAAWPMLWQSSVLIALVFALDMALRQRVRATTRYALWLLVLAKLVVPASLSLPTGVAYWVPAPAALTPPLQPEAAQQRGPTDGPMSLATGQTLQPEGQSEAVRQSGPTDRQMSLATGQTLQGQKDLATSQTLRWRGVAALLWVAGMAALAGVLACRTRVTRRLIAGATGTEDFSGMLSECASRLGVRRRVTLKLSGAAAAPAVCGLFRPVILLPTALASRLSAAQMEAVLSHELAHVRRGDPWVNYIQALLQIFYFYNPLLWLANAAIRRVREEAVDELVLVAMGDEASLYPETLLQVAKFTMQTARPGFGWVGILEKKSTVGGRIRLMLRRPWPKSARLGLRGGLAVAVVAAVLLPMSTRPQQQNPAPGVASSLRLDPSPAGNPLQQQLPSRQALVPSGSPQVNALCAAIYERRWLEALQMIDSGVAVNGVDEQLRTPLDCLVERWYMPTTEEETPFRLEVLHKLLQHGADPFAASATTYRLDDVHSPVEKAMAYADTALGHTLLTNNASPAHRTPSGETALHLAVQQGCTNIIDNLLSQGFSANQTNEDGLTALQELAGLSPSFVFIPAGSPPPYFMHAPSNSAALAPGQKGYAAYVEAIAADFLLSRGATLDVLSAAGMGLTNQLATLLRSNPNMANARDNFGRSPLHYAASGQSNAMALLLRAGADPAARSARAVARKYSTPMPAGSAPLHFACSHENLVTAQLLVKAGAPLAQADAQGDTALHIAAHWGDTNIPKMLISAGAPLDATNRAGLTALRFAIQSGGSGNVEQLLKAGARKDVGLENTTLLHVAAAPNGEPSRNDAMPDASWRARGSARVIPALLAAGLAVDARDGHGRTPFQRAVTALNLAAMEMLLTNGADINAVDLHGDTALHQISNQAWDKVTVETYSQPASPVGQKTQSDQPVQQQARMATMTNISVTAWLLEHGANPNLTNHDGQTPLQLLQTHKWTVQWDERDSAARIALLLKAGAKVRGENEPKSGPVPDPICVKLQALFQKYYPKATFTNSEGALSLFVFEYEVGTFEVPADTKSGDAANPSGAQQRTERGPKKGGILCDVLIQKGKDIGQLVLRDEGGGYQKFVIDRKVYKQYLMAPYSAKRDAHLWVRLLCPSDTSEDFLKGFDAIMTDFQKDAN